MRETGNPLEMYSSELQECVGGDLCARVDGFRRGQAERVNVVVRPQIDTCFPAFPFCDPVRIQAIDRKEMNTSTERVHKNERVRNDKGSDKSDDKEKRSTATSSNGHLPWSLWLYTGLPILPHPQYPRLCVYNPAHAVGRAERLMRLQSVPGVAGQSVVPVQTNDRE